MPPSRSLGAAVAALALLAAGSGTVLADESTPTPTGRPTETAPAPFPGMPTAFAHLRADPELGVVLKGSLARTDGAVATFSCRAPCDFALPLMARYRLAVGQRYSAWFELQAEPGQHLVITASVPSNDTAFHGVTLIVLGSIAIPVGFGLLVLGMFAGQCGDPDPTTCPNVAGYVAGGLASIAAGAGGLVGGILVLGSSRRVRAEQSVSELLLPTVPRIDTAWLRAPAWRESGAGGALRERGWGVPLFSRSF
jgi:hypothetical protein